MKKLFLSVAVLAALASCSKNDVMEIPSSQGQEIGFSTLNDRVTKVANTNAADAAGTTTYSDYKVYAIKTGTSAEWYINGETVGSDDIMTSKYYWPADNTLDFFAYAPASLVKDTSTTFGDVDLTYTVTAAANIDFTVATPISAAESTDQDGTTGSTSTPTDNVPLAFKHMLAKATISIKLEGVDAGTDEDTQAAIDTGLAEEHTFSFDNLTFTVVNDEVTVDATVASPAPTAVAAGDGDTKAYTYTYSTLTGLNEYVAAQELMFAPHASGENCSITINNLKIVNNSNSEVYSGSPVYTISSQAFEYGKAYAITITISTADTDIFDGTSPISFKSEITTNAWGSGSVSLTDSDTPATAS